MTTRLTNPAACAKRTKCLSALVAQCLLLIAGLASAGEVSFSAKPTATKAGDGLKIAFTVSAPTDVEVAVLSADGKVIRSLAPGCSAPRARRPSP